MLTACNYAYAQEPGIHFEKSLTWQEVKEKAKAENKNVFVDCYTTWCGPCRLMDAEIFSKDSVGRFMEDHFISMRAQMDSTQKDPADVVAHYVDAHWIEQHYRIKAYPTFLFLTPEGKLIGRGEGTVKWQNSFIAMADNALKSGERLGEYRRGRKDSAFLRHLSLDANALGDSVLLTGIGRDYLECVSEPLARDNIAMMTLVTQNSTDTGFDFFKKNRDAIDVIEPVKGYSIRVIGNIIKRERIMPALEAGRSWMEIYGDVVARYPDIGDEVVRFFHMWYDVDTGNWDDYGKQAVDFMKRYGSRWNNDANMLNAMAYNAFLHCNDRTVLVAALEWAHGAVQLEDDEFTLDTFANLLYKLKRTKEAINWEEKAVSVAKNNVDYEQCLQKMKTGVKTW